MNAPLSKPVWLTPVNIVWLALYLLTMGAIIGGLNYAARQSVELESPEAQAKWDEFRADMKKIQDDPDAPVARRMPKSAQPPQLRLLRDHFGVVLLMSLLLSTALFVTLMVMIRGAFASPGSGPRPDQ